MLAVEMPVNRILIVDDEPRILQSWATAMELAGYFVSTAKSAKNALERCDEYHFDVVILDYLMPEMDGLELLIRIRKRLPLVRSIIVSGKIDRAVDEEEVKRKLKESVEADVYLHKPISNERLRRTVMQLLELPPASDWQQIAKTTVNARNARLKTAKEASKHLKKLRKRK